MTDNMIIETFGIFDNENRFTLDEAVEKMYLHLAKKEDLKKSKNEKTSEITGFVCGILHVNDEIELVLKFLHGLTQVNKKEFENNFEVFDD